MITDTSKEHHLDNINSAPVFPNRGASFGTHKLIAEGSSELKYKPSPLAIIFGLVFQVLGIGSTISCFIAVIFTGELGAATGIFVGVLFIGVGWYIKKIINLPRVINRYDRRVVVPKNTYKVNSELEILSFDQIIAVQVLKKSVNSSERTYTCYELNLISDNGKRYNFADHADGDQIIKDANQIAQMVGCVVVREY